RELVILAMARERSSRGYGKKKHPGGFAGVFQKKGTSLRGRVRWRGRRGCGLAYVGGLPRVVGLARSGRREKRHGVLRVLLDLVHGRDLVSDPSVSIRLRRERDSDLR